MNQHLSNAVLEKRSDTQVRTQKNQHHKNALLIQIHRRTTELLLVEPDATQAIKKLLRLHGVNDIFSLNALPESALTSFWNHLVEITHHG